MDPIASNPNPQRRTVPASAALPNAKDMERAHRLLAERFVPDGQGNSDALGVLERGATAIIGFPAGAAPAAKDAMLAEIQPALQSCRQDPWFLHVPELGLIADALAFLIDVLLAWPNAPASAAPADAKSPRWIRWLVARARLFRWDFTVDAAFLADFDLNDPAIAWAVFVWWNLYGPAETAAPEAIGRCQKLLHSYKSLQDLAQALPASEKVLKNDFSLYARIVDNRRQARQAAGQQPPAGRREAAAGLEQLWKHAKELPLLLRCWWEPVAAYAYAVSIAASAPQQARAILEPLVSGPKGAEARAQLALIALAANDTVAAGRWLEGPRANYPGPVYARALLFSRRGDAEAARAELREFETLFAAAPRKGIYHAAAKRLEGAIEARLGNHTLAENHSRSILAAAPHDPVASARLGRLLVRAAYAAPPPAAGPLLVQARPLLTAAPGIGWSVGYLRLCDLLCSPAATSQATSPASSPGMLPDPWTPPPFVVRQLDGRRCLEAGRPLDARAALSGSASAPPEWYCRAQAIVQAWHHLSTWWPSAGAAPASAQELARRLQPVIETLTRLTSSGADPLAQQWLFLLQQAVALAEGTAAAMHAPAWRSAAPPLDRVMNLWSPDPTQRTAAAQEISDLANTAAAPDGDKRLQLPPWAWKLATAVSHWILGRHDEFLRAYEAIGKDLDALPVHGRQLWVAAASVWLAKKQWNRLLSPDRPKCADLAAPAVRLLIALAHAQSAADKAAAGDALAALQDAHRGREMLGPLVKAAVAS
jgi:hypothetical protein